MARSSNAPTSAAARRHSLQRKTVFWLGITAVLWIAGVSVWNTLRLSLPPPSPTTTISARETQHVVQPSSVFLEPLTLPTSTGAVWTQTFHQPLIVPPVVDEHRIYVVVGRTSDDTRVVAARPETGEPIWTLPLGSVVDHPATIAGPLLYVGTRSGRLLAIEAATGIVRWSLQMGAAVAGPALVRDGTLYVGSSDLAALDAATGKTRWRHRVGNGVAWPIAMDHDVVVVLAADSHFYLVSAGNGKRRLSFPLWFSPAGGSAISQRVVAFAGTRGMVQAIDLQGTEIPFEKAVRWWRTRLYLWEVINSPPPVPRGYLWQQRKLGGATARALGGDGAATYYAVDEETGGGRVVSLANGDGHVNWQAMTRSRVGRSAVFLADLIVVSSQSGSVHAFEIATGERVWQFDVGHPLSAAPAFFGDLMIAGSTDGSLSAFRLASP